MRRCTFPRDIPHKTAQIQINCFWGCKCIFISPYWRNWREKLWGTAAMGSSASWPRTAHFAGVKQQRPEWSRNMWLPHFSGLSKKSSLGFYSEKSPSLQYCSTQHICRWLVKEYNQFVQQHGGNRACSQSSPIPLCSLWVPQCFWSPAANERHCVNRGHANGFVSSLWQLGYFFSFQYMCEHGRKW